MQLPYVKKPSFDKVSTPRHSTASISPLTNKNIIVSPRSITKPTRKDLELLQDETLPYNLTKVALSFKNWSDSRISWSSLPSTVRDLGKVHKE